MAILPICLGIQAEILINHQPAKEYDDKDEIQVDHEDEHVVEHQATHTVAKYIQSETGQTFSIRFTVGAPFVKGKVIDPVKLGFHVYIDGCHVGDRWCSRTFFKNKPVGTKWVEELDGIPSPHGSLGFRVKEFKFASISTNGNAMGLAEVRRLAQEIKKVGVIEVRVHSETGGKQSGQSSVTGKGLILQGGKVVPEAALKGDAKTHGTTLGKAKHVKKIAPNVLNKVKSKDYPQVIFRFLYRDEESLKQLHVIEGPPSPSASSSRSPSPERSLFMTHEAETKPAGITGLTAEDRATIAAALRLLDKSTGQSATSGASGASKGKGNEKESEKERFMKIKRERNEEEREKQRAAKRARKGKPAGPPIVVDLTADSDEEDE